MCEIRVNAISAKVRDLCLEANYVMGEDLPIAGGDFEAAINHGVHEPYDVGELSKPMVEKAITARRNPRDNTPAGIDARLVPGDRL